MTTRSFSIYQALPHESPLRQRALSLANMGHEVMKDYSNIVSGLAKAIQVTQQESPMLLSQICRILEAGTRETIAPARLHIHLEGDILIEGYYDFFIVLNNLIINAAQAGAHQITAELTAKTAASSCAWLTMQGAFPTTYCLISFSLAFPLSLMSRLVCHPQGWGYVMSEIL